MKYHAPELPVAVDVKTVAECVEALGIPAEYFRGITIGLDSMTVTVVVLDENDQTAVNAKDYSLVTTDVVIPIARSRP